MENLAGLIVVLLILIALLSTFLGNPDNEVVVNGLALQHEQPLDSSTKTSEETLPSNMRTCPGCGGPNRDRLPTCVYCGTDLRE